MSQKIVPKSESIGSALKAARDPQRLRELIEKLRPKIDNATLPLIGWGVSKPRIHLITPEQSKKKWFFIGDLHGDFVAWIKLYERIKEHAGENDFGVLFLGDLIDRGPNSLECVVAMFEAILKHENQFLWIRGNHDEALKFDRNKRSFSSTVDPAEFVHDLHKPREGESQEDLIELGRCLIEIVRRLPVAAIFPDGLLATHGGVPLKDQWPRLKNMESFHSEQCLADFTWTRAAEVPRRLFDKQRRELGSSAFEYGFKDLDDFCTMCNENKLLTYEIQRVVRGHDHVELGESRHPKFVKTPLLTINGFGFNHLTNSCVDGYRSEIVLGIYKAGELPEVERIAMECPVYIEVSNELDPPTIPTTFTDGVPRLYSSSKRNRHWFDFLNFK